MTRARALKQVIRARVAKTGERYTTARRHVLNTVATAARPAAPPRQAPAPPPPVTKGSVSDTTARAKTGHGLDHWFSVLDRFDGFLFVLPGAYYMLRVLEPYLS